ncbi:unnamed protein product [Ixodes persulcatus]
MAEVRVRRTGHLQQGQAEPKLGQQNRDGVWPFRAPWHPLYVALAPPLLGKVDQLVLAGCQAAQEVEQVVRQGVVLSTLTVCCQEHSDPAQVVEVLGGPVPGSPRGLAFEGGSVCPVEAANVGPWLPVVCPQSVVECLVATQVAAAEREHFPPVHTGAVDPVRKGCSHKPAESGTAAKLQAATPAEHFEPTVQQEVRQEKRRLPHLRPSFSDAFQRARQEVVWGRKAGIGRCPAAMMAVPPICRVTRRRGLRTARSPSSSKARSPPHSSSTSLPEANQSTSSRERPTARRFRSVTGTRRSSGSSGISILSESMWTSDTTTSPSCIADPLFSEI